MQNTQGQPGQYLSREELLKIIPEVKVQPQDLGTSDTYNETKILEKFLSLPSDGQELVYKAAIQLAIIGYGNKNFGFIRINEKEIIKLEDIFKKYKIKYLESLNTKYSDDDLSMRRLIRLFRHQIQKFIMNTGRPSYLYLKYSVRNPEFVSICFPMAEHLVDTIEQANYLLETYGNLDKAQNTRFVERLKRVFIARGIIKPEFFI